MLFQQNTYHWLMTTATLKWHQFPFWNEGWSLVTTNQLYSGSFSGQIFLLLKQHGKMLISYARCFHLFTLEDKDVKKGAIVSHTPWRHLQFRQSNKGAWRSEEVGALHTSSSTSLLTVQWTSNGCYLSCCNFHFTFDQATPIKAGLDLGLGIDWTQTLRNRLEKQ